MVLFKKIQLVLLLAAIIAPDQIESAASISDWNNPNSNQYHIQTDEGAERYFRYQTISGQFRKEKRLDDGTVIGTYAWIDDDGFLRQRDYIADNAGYRILKTKNVYVGRDTPIDKAMKIAKTSPPTAGTLVRNNPIISKSALPSSTPIVQISHNSIASTTVSPLDYSASPPVTPPATVTIAPKLDGPTNLYLPASTVALDPSSTPAPFALNPWYYSSAPQYDHPSTERPPHFQHGYASAPQYDHPSTERPALLQNGYASAPQYEHPSTERPPHFHNGPTYPIDSRGNIYTGNNNNNNLGNGYDPQYSYYDGVSVTNDGFRYYIPRAYHEEQSITNDKKSGSFGYIDPFGIRRVIYYNAGPDGFQHRKNNRYVGFDATPYDPRPY